MDASNPNAESHQAKRHCCRIEFVSTCTHVEATESTESTPHHHFLTGDTLRAVMVRRRVDTQRRPALRGLDPRHSSHPADASAQCLGQRLVGSTSVVFSAVREEPVDDHTDDGEEEDDQTPDELRCRGAIGLEDLNCVQWRGQLRVYHSAAEHQAEGGGVTY